MIKLDKIKIDGTQSRVALNNEVRQDYAEAMRCGAKFPPVKLFYDGSTYWLADGFHRYFATKDIQANEIEADIENGTKDDALLYSLGANQSHGLQRTSADKRHAVSIILNHKTWREWSNRTIAKECAVSLDLVNRLRKEFEENNKPKVNDSFTTPTPMLDVASEIEKNTAIQPVKLEVETVDNLNEYTAEDMLKDENAELSKAVTELTEKLAIGDYKGSDNVEKIIADLKAENLNLVVELGAVKKSRDSLLNENNQLKKQIAMQQKEIKKLSK